VPEAVARAGYDYALTTVGVPADMGCDRFAVPRGGPVWETRAGAFAARLAWWRCAAGGGPPAVAVPRPSRCARRRCLHEVLSTCPLGRTNLFDCLTALPQHAADLRANVPLWMPWNFPRNPHRDRGAHRHRPLTVSTRRRRTTRPVPTSAHGKDTPHCAGVLECSWLFVPERLDRVETGGFPGRVIAEQYPHAR